MKFFRPAVRLLFNRIPPKARQFAKLYLLPPGFIRPIAAALDSDAPPKQTAKRPRPKHLSTAYSLVVACHNVEPYIDDFFGSLLAQSVDLTKLEIIAVDDGSTDGTAARIAEWMDRLPIRYIHQPNQGQAAARNAGLPYATGTWVSFPDPDDFFSRDYLERVDEEVLKPHGLELAMVSCNLIFFKESKRRNDDSHPLRYRFSAARTILPASNLENHMQLSTATAWFRRSMVDAHDLRFDPRVLPTFEDGHFANRFLLLNPQTEVAFLKAPIYYYRKRLSADSTLDGAKLTRAWYLDALRFGYLDILRCAKAIVGEVPRFIQRTVLYDIAWRFNYLADHPERAAFLTEAERSEVFALLAELFTYIDSATINTFNLAHCYEEYKTGILGMMKGTRRPVTNAYVRHYDPAKRLVQFSYLSSAASIDATVRVNDHAVPLRYTSRRRVKVLGRTFYYEHFFWVAIDKHDYLTISVQGGICALKRGGIQLGTMATFRELRQSLLSASASEDPEPSRSFKNVAAGADPASRYRNCWLLMDRDDKADDNAEHLYRYLLSTGGADNAFFVLRVESSDWTRLEAEGFNLIAFDSPEHRLALRNAKFIISSHANQFVFTPGPHARGPNMTNCRFVFLQHGITKDDLSRWLNSKPIARFITATVPETTSIADPQSEYRFSAKEVALTGLCRHDKLLSLTPSESFILIMPTWRDYLRGQPLAHSIYASRWRSLLQSPRLKQLADEKGIKLVLCVHPNMAPFIAAFDAPPHVELRNPLAIESLQPLFADATLLVTDYSSVAFDLAYLQKPVVYYQFDAAEFFGGTHVYERGYFDYGKDGFGPVCAAEDEVLDHVQTTLSGDEAPQFAERRRSAFPFRDGKCCERVHQSILDLDAPRDDHACEITLKAYTQVPNAGDAASSAVLSHFVTAPVRVVGREHVTGPNLLGIGSILHWSDSRSVVWGTGFQSVKERLRELPDKVFAIRGPLSRQRLLEAGCPCPPLYGDPGILISSIFPRRAGTPGRLGLIPHYVDRDHPFVEAARAFGAEIIDPGLPLPDYLSMLMQCECILSSSLHGIVFAHSYGIPATWVKLSPKVVGGGFKFHDYYLSIGLDPRDLPDLSSDDALSAAVRSASTPRDEIDRHALRRALEHAQQYIFDRQTDVP